MEGLRTQEDSKFERFFQIVQNAAKQMDSVFFLDTGEGRDVETETISGEDLSGWLIAQESASEFKQLWENFKDIPTKWNDCYRIAVWSQNPDISIKFVTCQ